MAAGEDILVALSAGSKNVTAVELNPLIVAAVKQYGGSSAGNLYNRKDVQLSIDDGRRFISSTKMKYDTIVIKLVDSWVCSARGRICTFRKLSLYSRGLQAVFESLKWS